jgi:Tol biopolymer transport system component
VRWCALLLVASLVSTSAAAAVRTLPGSIVFERFFGAQNEYQLYRERPDGSGRVRLTYSGGSYTNANWSPDRKQIVMLGPPGIVVANANGHVVRRLRAPGSASQPRWSPDGKHIAFLVQHCEGPGQEPACADLWVMRPDGGGRKRLGPSKAVDTAQLGTPYSWSPDGRRIVYVGMRGLVVVSIATGRARLLGAPTHLVEQFPAWSRDGRSILFARQRAPFQTSDLVTVAPDGTGLRRIAHTTGAIEPRWSPDGRLIAYLMDQSDPNANGSSVFVARPDGTHRVRVGVASDYQVLVWGPDSAHLLFPVGGDTFRIARADGRGRPVTIPGGEEPDWR